jgi:hypothetical protein
MHTMGRCSPHRYIATDRVDIEALMSIRPEDVAGANGGARRAGVLVVLILMAVLVAAHLLLKRHAKEQTVCLFVWCSVRLIRAY